MPDLESVRIGTEQDRARYANRLPLQRAQDAQELATEVLDHVEHLRPLLHGLVRELRALGTEETKAALHLAEVAQAWLTDDDHVAQASRLFACLHVNVQASHSAEGASHG